MGVYRVLIATIAHHFVSLHLHGLAFDDDASHSFTPSYTPGKKYSLENLYQKEFQKTHLLDIFSKKKGNPIADSIAWYKASYQFDNTLK